MRKRIFLKISTALFFISATASFVSAQGTGEPRTVTDHLLALPANLFEHVHPGFRYETTQPKTKAQADEFRRSRILVEDVKNGFIKYKVDPNLDNWTEIALFRKNAGGYVLAINQVGKAKGCDSTLNFVEYNNGKWIDVTKQYSPKLNASETRKAKESVFCYELPREGRTLRLYSQWYDEPAETWGYFEWNGRQFVEKP